MMVLNPGYDNNELATEGKGSLYWNRQSGSCPFGSGTTFCDFTSTGLKEEAQKMIGDAKWYLGGINYQETSSVSEIYQKERGEETCTTIGACTKQRKTNWTGKVGLMYPSDYGYATSGGTSETRDYCMSIEGTAGPFQWYVDDVDEFGVECIKGDWLFKQEYYDEAYCEGVISPDLSGSDAGYIMILGSSGTIFPYDASDYNVERPVVYLTSNIKLLKGTGSELDPFEFGL